MQGGPGDLGGDEVGHAVAGAAAGTRKGHPAPLTAGQGAAEPEGEGIDHRAGRGIEAHRPAGLDAPAVDGRPDGIGDRVHRRRPGAGERGPAALPPGDGQGPGAGIRDDAGAVDGAERQIPAGLDVRGQDEGLGGVDHGVAGARPGAAEGAPTALAAGAEGRTGEGQGADGGVGPGRQVHIPGALQGDVRQPRPGGLGDGVGGDGEPDGGGSAAPLPAGDREGHAARVRSDGGVVLGAQGQVYAEAQAGVRDLRGDGVGDAVAGTAAGASEGGPAPLPARQGPAHAEGEGVDDAVAHGGHAQGPEGIDPPADDGRTGVVGDLVDRRRPGAGERGPAALPPGDGQGPGARVGGDAGGVARIHGDRPGHADLGRADHGLDGIGDRIARSRPGPTVSAASALAAGPEGRASDRQGVDRRTGGRIQGERPAAREAGLPEDGADTAGDRVEGHRHPERPGGAAALPAGCGQGRPAGIGANARGVARGDVHRTGHAEGRARDRRGDAAADGVARAAASALEGHAAATSPGQGAADAEREGVDLGAALPLQVQRPGLDRDVGQGAPDRAVDDVGRPRAGAGDGIGPAGTAAVGDIAAARVGSDAGAVAGLHRQRPAGGEAGPIEGLGGEIQGEAVVAARPGTAQRGAPGVAPRGADGAGDGQGIEVAGEVRADVDGGRALHHGPVHQGRDPSIDLIDGDGHADAAGAAAPGVSARVSPGVDPGITARIAVGCIAGTRVRGTPGLVGLAQP